MTDRQNPESASDDTDRMSEAFKRFAERSQRIINAFVERQAEDGGFQLPDPFVVGSAFFDLGAKLISDPAKLTEAQAGLWRGYAQLWETTARRLSGEQVAPVVAPDPADKRFKDKDWDEELVFDVVKQSYLLTAKWLQATVRNVDGLDPKTAEKVNFYTRQIIDAASPSNFVATNPKVLKATIESKGENLISGLDHMLEDLETGKGQLKISMTDAEAFTLGVNVAASPGKVVFQNDLIQLLQYAPASDTVAKRPLLIVPPWINKYYVLDLQPKNSFIKWAVGSGITVFVISWINPDHSLSHKTFDDYMMEGPLAAMQAIEKATGEREINLIGYCIGGTLLAATLAHIAGNNDPKWQGRVASATYFTTMVDFEEPGELGVFIDEEQLALLEEHMERKGYLDGTHMAQVFNMLRDNDLIWSFVVNNYLLGREPLAFDLLYWNSDNTRMPAMMHGMYLRKMYLENKLVEPGGITLAGVPLDLRKIDVPTYIISTSEDHIAPWKSTYKATQLYGGPVKFVLSASGHIAGVINPPAAGKYCYWTNPRKAKNPDVWFKGAVRHEGSWWPDWLTWIGKFAGGRVEARVPGKGGLKAIEDAPGAYAKVRIGA
ncbi:MAG: class I poly(R)-hydroxyalkanoic acid synthase [Rhodospirillales bacterium]|nr:class I poly(R)-hydroxyalkanoic acid synthase [Rhodospirillales bacterium]